MLLLIGITLNSLSWDPSFVYQVNHPSVPRNFFLELSMYCLILAIEKEWPFIGTCIPNLLEFPFLKFGWNGQVVLEEEVFIKCTGMSTYFNNFAISASPIEKCCSPSFEQTWKTFNLVCFVQRLVEFKLVVLKEIKCEKCSDRHTDRQRNWWWKMQGTHHYIPKLFQDRDI